MQTQLNMKLKARTKAAFIAAKGADESWDDFLQRCLAALANTPRGHSDELMRIAQRLVEIAHDTNSDTAPELLKSDTVSDTTPEPPICDTNSDTTHELLRSDTVIDTASEPPICDTVSDTVTESLSSDTGIDTAPELLNSYTVSDTVSESLSGDTLSDTVSGPLSSVKGKRRTSDEAKAKRDQQILSLIKEGKKNAEITKLMRCSNSVVSALKKRNDIPTHNPTP